MGPASNAVTTHAYLFLEIAMLIPPLPPDHVRVLIECNRHDYLVNLALERLGEASRSSPTFEEYLQSSFGKLDWMHLDERFAIPLELHPKDSKRFLVRGSMEANKIRAVISDERGGEPARIFSDPMVGAYRMEGLNRPIGDTARVRQRLRTEALWREGFDGSGVAIAIVDSGIYLPRLTEQLGFEPSFDRDLSWKPDSVVTQPGEHRLGHGTMCAYDALIVAPKATLIDIPMLISRTTGDHRVNATLSAAAEAYQHLIQKWVVGPRPNYKRLVVSNSWGIFNPSLDDFAPGHTGRYIDNLDHAFRTQIKRLCEANVDIVFCGSNCGPECTSAACLSQTDGMIMGANAYPEVLTVGGCDTDNDVIGYSSRGPARTMFSRNEVHQEADLKQKPDISAYTHFLGSKTRRNYLPDTGVSAACPVAAGCIAALRTKALPEATRPDALFSIIKQTARGNKSGPGGTWNGDFGHGIIDPVEAARRLGLIQ
jgi:hypothetical protein